MIITGKYPKLRMRRSRKTDWMRRLVRENSLSSNDFILPIFVTDGKNKKIPIKTMPEVFRYSVDKLGQIVDRALKLKIPMVAIFPQTNNVLKDSKDDLSYKSFISYLTNLHFLLSNNMNIKANK